MITEERDARPAHNTLSGTTIATMPGRAQMASGVGEILSHIRRCSFPSSTAPLRHPGVLRLPWRTVLQRR